MGAELIDLLNEVRATRDALASGDTERDKVLQKIKADIDRLTLRVGRPGLDNFDDDASRKAAIGLLKLKHDLKIPKTDAQLPFVPSEDAINEAKNHIDAIKALMRSADVGRLPDFQRKALSSFSFGSNGFILPVEMSARILSCLTDVTDITSLMDNVTISGSSIKFLVDQGDLDIAAWACQTSCFKQRPCVLLQNDMPTVGLSVYVQAFPLTIEVPNARLSELLVAGAREIAAFKQIGELRFLCVADQLSRLVRRKAHFPRSGHVMERFHLAPSIVRRDSVAAVPPSMVEERLEHRKHPVGRILRLAHHLLVRVLGDHGRLPGLQFGGREIDYPAVP
ncbi:hypothetical protein [Bradyrhizobium canariense]|uniref:hypothetical protein n=1 Tax=Bradyrhizobium canariense TaxID=255045 RepID=UPI000A19ABE9|nr:hypothetical protein [Bradyrhizobium canariense]OSI33030.1 hypothetical protein BST65_03405 [Bradyrhizobium canariense]OSI36972.1 hypothetical protein BST66_04765 [Bradyrhizobium canariense]OSI53468.1 hypothetical protein BSZ20_03125 [Bradyrhizobium canariense]OSI56702.1 hypothetical protein BST67_02925 [Bradyrhizobium canariense]OSI59096.1 hypothetical protein BSZ15_06505 [Bradyrhizobium canariense]